MTKLLLIPVSERPDDAVQVLWDLLAERPAVANISHRQMPTFEEHEQFVENNPYYEWYLIEADCGIVGAIYITHAYEIGIAIFSQHQRKGYAKQAVYMLMAENGKQRYLANVAPGNEASKAFWRKIGFRHIQETYCAD